MLNNYHYQDLHELEWLLMHEHAKTSLYKKQKDLEIGKPCVESYYSATETLMHKTGKSKHILEIMKNTKKVKTN